MENCGVIGEVRHEVAEVVDEAEKRMELVRVSRQGKLLDTCNLGEVGEHLTGAYNVS